MYLPRTTLYNIEISHTDSTYEYFIRIVRSAGVSIQIDCALASAFARPIRIRFCSLWSRRAFKRAVWGPAHTPQPWGLFCGRVAAQLMCAKLLMPTSIDWLHGGMRSTCAVVSSQGIVGQDLWQHKDIWAGPFKSSGYTAGVWPVLDSSFLLLSNRA